MEPITQGLLVGAGGSMMEGVFSNHQSNKQRAWSEYMWHKQNAYNTPAKQMERLRKAGLNPALMYGQGNTGNAQQAMAYQQAKTPNFGATMNQAFVAGNQLDLQNSQKELIEEQKALTAAQAFKATIDGSYRIKDYDLRKDLQEHEINHLMFKNRKIDSDIEVNQSLVSLNEVKGRLDEAKIELTSAQRIQVFNMINKVQQDMELQQFLIDEHKRGFGSKSLVTLGNLLNIGDVNTADARWKALGVAISSLPVVKGAKVGFQAAKKAFGKWYAKNGEALVNAVFTANKRW